METVRWNGEGFKITGRVLTSQDVERWLESEGKSFLEEKAKALTGSWFRGRSRVRKDVLASTRDDTNRNGPLASALSDTLNKISEVIRNRANHIAKTGHPALSRKNAVGVTVVVPRGLVQDRFVRLVRHELGGTAAMTTYAGLPEIFLAKRALEAESQFFDSLVRKSPYVFPSKNGLIHSVDSEYNWRQWDAHGHYYLAYETLGEPNFSKRAKRKEFISKIAPDVNHVQVTLGKLTEAELESVVSSLAG